MCPGGSSVGKGSAGSLQCSVPGPSSALKNSGPVEDAKIGTVHPQQIHLGPVGLKPFCQILSLITNTRLQTKVPPFNEDLL